MRFEHAVGSLRGDPVQEALNRDRPGEMGLADGWDRNRFLKETKITTTKGEAYQNLCIGCDRFHDKVLKPRIKATRQKRRARIATS